VELSGASTPSPAGPWRRSGRPEPRATSTRRSSTRRRRGCGLSDNSAWRRVSARTIRPRSLVRWCTTPRSISFKATLQVLEAFQPLIASQPQRGLRHRESLYQEVLRAIARHRVADRPDRFEPRMAKRRPKNYDRLRKPRKKIKLDMIKRLRII